MQPRTKERVVGPTFALRTDMMLRILLASLALALLTAGAPVPPTDTSSAAPLNVNVATVEELRRLPGIGPTKARAIVRHRSRRLFRRYRDLLRVKGIGRHTLRRLRPHITIRPPDP